MTALKTNILTIVVIAALQAVGYSQPLQSARTTFEKANALVVSNPEKAYSAFKQAMEESKRAGDWTGYINAINAMASLSFRIDREKVDEAFSLGTEAMKSAKNNVADSALAGLHYSLGQYYNLVAEEVERPVDHYQMAMKIWRSLDGEMSQHVADCYHGLGDVYKYNKFDFNEAEKCYETALLIREKIHMEDTSVLYGNYYSLAATNRSQHDYEKALSYGSKALNMAGKDQIERTYVMVANIYRDLHQSELAKKYYLQALAISRRTTDLENQAWIYMSLGETFKNDSLYNEALDNFLKAERLYESPAVTDKTLFIHLLQELAKTYAALHDDHNFSKTIQKTFNELTSLNKLQSNTAYQTFLLPGDHYEKQGALDSALVYYQKALRAAIPSFHPLTPEENPTEEMIGLSYYVYEGLAKKASALLAKFHLSGNRAYLKQAIGSLVLAEKLVSLERNNLDMENAKWEFLDANYDLYENILSALYEGRGTLPDDTVYRTAFHYFEKSKSRSLADALAQADQQKQISNEDSLFELHTELKRKIAHTQNLISEVSRIPEEQEKTSSLREELVGLDRKMQACKLAIEDRYPGYFKVKYDDHVPALKEVQQIAGERRMAVLEYFWGTECVYAMGINEKSIIFRKVGTPDSIKAVINQVLTHLQAEHSSMDQEVFHRFATQAHAAYRILVEPFEALLPEGGRVHIIPDGPIGQIPFEILLEKGSDAREVNYRGLTYFIKSHAIGYAYASAMLVHHENTAVRNPSVLGVGFTGGQRLRAAETNLEDIAGAELELEALAKRFSHEKFLVGGDATEANFKLLSPDFDIIHLAVHGRGDVQRNFSASLFFRTKYDSIDDGVLHAYELYGLKLKAVLAVLSACESGLGIGYKGEGMISMASAFTYAGCENILMSLWKVNDQASNILMDDFYGELLKGEDIDDALRNTKLHYLAHADELAADPKIWAPLVAYGSLNPVFHKDRKWIYILGSLLLAGLVFLGAFGVRKYYFGRLSPL